MKLNIKKKLKKPLIKKRNNFVIPSLTSDQVSELKYLKKGAFSHLSPTPKELDGYDDEDGYDNKNSYVYDSIHSCRESARYDFEEILDDRRQNDYYQLFYHPDKADISFINFLRKFDRWFDVKNNFIQKDCYLLLKKGDNYWTSSVLTYEVFTLICRSYHVIPNPSEINSLSQWAREVEGKDLLSEAVVAAILKHKKIAAFEDVNYFISNSEGFVNFVEDDLDNDSSLRYLLNSKITVKQLLNLLND